MRDKKLTQLWQESLSETHKKIDNLILFKINQKYGLFSFMSNYLLPFVNDAVIAIEQTIMEKK